MTDGVAWAYETDSVDKAVKIMSERQVRRLPVSLRLRQESELPCQLRWEWELESVCVGPFAVFPRLFRRGGGRW